jgi:hypothetical protein
MWHSQTWRLLKKKGVEIKLCSKILYSEGIIDRDVHETRIYAFLLDCGMSKRTYDESVSHSSSQGNLRQAPAA